MSGTHPQYPWAEGDALFASALNAAIANSAAYGPFLPTSGGPLSGPLTINNNVTYTAASAHSLFVNGVYSGTTTDTGQPTHNLFLAYDNVHAANVNSMTNVANYYTLTGGSTGARIAQQISFVVSGNTADAPGNTHFFQGLASTATINGSLGGTAGSYGGSITGNNTIATLGTNGKFVGGMMGIEIDVAAMAGSSVHYKGGLLVALQGLDAVESDVAASIAIGIGLSSDSPASHGWGRGLAFGSAGGWWPMNPTTGIMIYADPAAIAGGPARTCATGVDFTAVTFGSAAWKSTGFIINPKGGIDFGGTDAASTVDTSRHITLFDGSQGINSFGGQVNFIGTAWVFRDVSNNQHAYLTSGGFVSMHGLGVWGAGGPGTKPAVTGAKGGNAALTSLLAALVSYGLVTDSST